MRLAELQRIVRQQVESLDSETAERKLFEAWAKDRTTGTWQRSGSAAGRTLAAMPWSRTTSSLKHSYSACCVPGKASLNFKPWCKPINH